jgi:hypothetical protein
MQCRCCWRSASGSMTESAFAIVSATGTGFAIRTESAFAIPSASD